LDPSLATNREDETSPIRFRSEQIAARFLSPDGAEVTKSLEVRFDPLLGTSSRIAEGVVLSKADEGALAPLQAPSPGCPFCPDRIRRVTPKVLQPIHPEGRLERGESVLFPNLVPYSQYAAVAVFSQRHWLALNSFTPQLLLDNFAVAVDYIRKVHAFDPRAENCAYNINYLYPSGGSLPHPHAQVYLDPHPTTLMRWQRDASLAYWTAHGRAYWDDLAEAEEARGLRFVARAGRVAWITAFAPIGFNEVRAVVSGRETLLDLTDDDLNSLSAGMARVLQWYELAGYNSFNLALYSGPLNASRGWRVHLSMITRTAMLPYYRSDAAHLERLHWEAAVDRAPERIAEDLRAHFAVSGNSD
jgi:UDPglucose--hexose-1-phosphate uridylyltransferase